MFDLYRGFLMPDRVYKARSRNVRIQSCTKFSTHSTNYLLGTRYISRPLDLVCPHTSSWGASARRYA